MKQLYELVGACLSAALLAACGGFSSSTTPMVAPQIRAASLLRQPLSSGFKSLYNFKGTPDGGTPYAGLLSADGTFYGTTWGGGATGLGTVFEVSTSGKERVLYSFKGSPDGEYPWAGLAELSGSLYGTTSGGGTGCRGSGGCGTVFALSTRRERVLHSFQGASERDGAYPQYNNGLLALKGLLYGMTWQGGDSKNYGTAFEISTAGKERVLYRFGSGARDGTSPLWGLTHLNGMFYGTTSNGGTLSQGTVFEMSPSGKERVLYRFKGGADGYGPVGSLIAVDGMLYGTTQGGGTGCTYLGGCGTVFAVSTSGKERVLYRFKGAPDGSQPEAGLTKVNFHKGMLYGTTYEGGTACTGSGSLSGCGTVFQVSTSGTETILHSFQGYADGAYPFGGLVSTHGMLYGTTSSGGMGPSCNGSGGCGTVFQISP